MVDPGDASPVLAHLARSGQALSAIFVTHHHPDHTGGISELLERWPVPVYGPHSRNIPQISDTLEEGDEILFGNIRFRIIEVPGHTLDHIAYYAQLTGEEPVLFCGDTLFSAGCGRLFEGTPEMMHQSLQKLAALPDNTRVYCTHEYTASNLAFALRVEPGNANVVNYLADVERLRRQNLPSLPSSIGWEKRVNPFLRCAEPSVAEAVARHSGGGFRETVNTFAGLRAWKDSFVL